MTLLRLLLRIVRLPVDFLFLTFDFGRIVAWTLWVPLTRLVRLPVQRDDPLHRGGDVLPTGSRDCPRAWKYGTRGLFRVICPYVRQTEDREPFCTFRPDDPQEVYWPSWLRRAVLGMALTVLWVGVLGTGVVGWYQLPFVQRWQEQERLARAKSESGEAASPSVLSRVSSFFGRREPSKTVPSRERTKTDRVRVIGPVRKQKAAPPPSHR